MSIFALMGVADCMCFWRTYSLVAGAPADESSSLPHFSLWFACCLARLVRFLLSNAPEVLVDVGSALFAAPKQISSLHGQAVGGTLWHGTCWVPRLGFCAC